MAEVLNSELNKYWSFLNKEERQNILNLIKSFAKLKGKVENSTEDKLDSDNKVAELKQAIQAGIDSGIAHNFDPVKHLSSLKAARQKNG